MKRKRLWLGGCGWEACGEGGGGGEGGDPGSERGRETAGSPTQAGEPEGEEV